MVLSVKIYNLVCSVCPCLRACFVTDVSSQIGWKAFFWIIKINVVEKEKTIACRRDRIILKKTKIVVSEFYSYTIN